MNTTDDAQPLSKLYASAWDCARHQPLKTAWQNACAYWDMSPPAFVFPPTAQWVHAILPQVSSQDCSSEQNAASNTKVLVNGVVLGHPVSLIFHILSTPQDAGVVFARAIEQLSTPNSCPQLLDPCLGHVSAVCVPPAPHHTGGSIVWWFHNVYCDVRGADIATVQHLSKQIQHALEKYMSAFLAE